jgi:hypothetical protein
MVLPRHTPGGIPSVTILSDRFTNQTPALNTTSERDRDRERERERESTRQPREESASMRESTRELREESIRFGDEKFPVVCICLELLLRKKYVSSFQLEDHPFESLFNGNAQHERERERESFAVAAMGRSRKKKLTARHL